MPRAALVLLPTYRVRDALRVTATVTVVCRHCRHIDPVDVIGLACRVGPQAVLQEAVTGLSCSRCGWKDGRERVEPPAPGPRYTLRIGDVIEPRGRLVARCGACHRDRPLDALALARNPRIGPDARAVELAERMRCSGCGRRGWVRLRLDP